jgi:hypothetical protein
MKYLQSLDFDFIEFLNFDEKPFRAKFNPSKIWDDLDKYENDATGLRNYFKKWRFSIVWHKEKKPTKHISVGGGYYTDEGRSELDIYTSPDTDFNRYKFTVASWDRFKFRIIQVAMHELIHCKQYYNKHEEYAASKVYFSRTGIEKIDTNRDYHAGRDEIEAYAHCVYLDFKTKRPTIPVAELIRHAGTYKVSKNLTGIQRVFQTDKHNEVVPLLLRKILTWERKYSKLNSQI